MERICFTALSIGIQAKNGVWPEHVDIFSNVNSPLLSPAFACDAALKNLPPINLVVIYLHVQREIADDFSIFWLLQCLEMDFCLDESVEFVKRCRRLGGEVHIDILPNLPHGFLTFALVSTHCTYLNMWIIYLNDLLLRETRMLQKDLCFAFDESRKWWFLEWNYYCVNFL